MKFRNSLVAAGALALIGASVVACGSGNGGEGGGEVALVSTSDPGLHLSFNYPGTWTRTSGAPLTFSGVDEYVSLEARPLADGNPLAAARADEAAIRAANPGYRPLSTAMSKEVQGAAVVSYEWDLAQSAATGKPVHQRADRYYINLGDGRVAILTGSSPSSRFDREQVRDIALTVQVTK